MKKEDKDRTLKRVQFEISNGEDHRDQERFRRLRALMTIEGPTSQRVERKIPRLSNCQDHPDLIVIAHNNLIVHIRGIGKESKDQT